MEVMKGVLLVAALVVVVGVSVVTLNGEKPEATVTSPPPAATPK